MTTTGTVFRAALLLLVLGFTGLLSCEDRDGNRDRKEVLFNYGQILRKEFKYNIGRIIPVTIERSIEIDGAFTPDGLYMLFASDRERGNFDIYLRSLTDITTVRITAHPSRDTSPVLSPDGKYLAFVSRREDPEGDVYVIRLDPQKLLEQAGGSVIGVPPLDDRAVNLTQYQDPVSKTVKIVKDASPAWSPDGKRIVFSSARDGIENLWMMDRKGKNLVPLTKRGGMYPRFSGDGTRIIFISYRDKGPGGEVYTLDVDTGRESRISSSEGIKLYPSFMGSTDEIVYTLIDRDTNGDGRIDLKDNSVIYYKNLKTKQEYPLTLYAASSFSPRWSPVYDGIIIYSGQEGENININIIPAGGIIPKRENAARQFELADRYLDEFDDTERYALGLDMTFQFCRDRKDTESVVSVTKALVQEAFYYRKAGLKKETARIRALLASLSRGENDYSVIAVRYLDEVFAGGTGEKILADAAEKVSQEKKTAGYAPYLIEDLGDEYYRLKKPGEAVRIYQGLLKEYPDYKRSIYLHRKLGNLTYREPGEEISPSYLKVLDSNYLTLKVAVTKRLLKVFEAEKSLTKRISLASGMLTRYRERAGLTGILEYILGKTYFQQGDIGKARLHLEACLKSVKKNELIYYRANVLLGDIAEGEKRARDAEKYYAPAANNYLFMWKEADFRGVVKKLIDFYEEYGERAELAGNNREAADLYQRYIRLLTYIHLIKGFEDLYGEYAPRAHVLYIDAFAASRGAAGKGVSGREQSAASLESLEQVYFKKLAVARMDFDKAHIYGLGYIYTRLALALEHKKTSALEARDTAGVLQYLRKAMNEIEWALFIDDTFIDSYLLKGWVYQYVDLRRKEDVKETGGRNEKQFNQYFPRYLWENNIALYEKALEANNENVYPEREGNLHLNLANTCFLLTNYPKALAQYELTLKYKKSFNSRKEEALFHYHLGYCYWQEDRLDRAQSEMKKTLFIYEGLATGKNVRKYKDQLYLLYRFFALFNRAQGTYHEAVLWYNRVMEFTATHRIPIDRARYLQEIAYCYREMGDTERALAYLGKAENLLRDYPDEEAKYYMKFKVFGFGPLSFYNLGPDVAVIGINRIYTELDTMNKKLLNVSLFEDIFYGKGDYRESIGYQKRKLALLEKGSSRVDLETKVRTLNNIGYGYFRLRQFDGAKKYFRMAWDFAADPKVNDMEGVFLSMMNASNLYAFMLENGLVKSGNPAGDIDALLGRIGAYRASYEKSRFEAERTRLKSAAEAKKREVRPGEIEELRERIVAEARGIHYTADIATGVLEYCKAELLFKKEIERKEDRIETARDLLRAGGEAYGLFAVANRRFRAAMEKAEKDPSKRLMVKLLVNSAACLKRMGQADNAYETLNSAEKMARSYEYQDLLGEVLYQTARFLVEYGKKVEGKNYLAAAEENFSGAARIMENGVYFFIDNVHRARSLYDDYADLLLKRGNPKKALQVSEKGTGVVRAALLRSLSPDFAEEKDRASFKTFKSLLERFGRLREEISSLREAGEAENSEKTAPLRRDLERKSRALADFFGVLRKSNPLLAYSLSVPPWDVPSWEGAVALKFIAAGGRLYAWKVEDGRIEFHELSGKSGKGDSPGALIASYLAGTGKKGGARFVVANETILKVLAGGDLTGYPSFALVPSLDRVASYLSPRNIAFRSVFINGSGLKKDLTRGEPFGKSLVDEGKVAEADLTRYSVIIDSVEGDGAMDPPFLYGRKMEPSLLIKKMNSIEPDDILLLSESSLFAGIRSVLLYRDLDTPALARLAREAAERTFDGLPAAAGFADRGVLCLGYQGLVRPEREKRMAGERDRLYAAYREGVKDKRLTRAAIYLNRWYEISGETPVNHARYLVDKAGVEELRDREASALGYLDRASALSAVAGLKDFLAQAMSRRIFILFSMGDMVRAGELLEENRDFAGLAESRDFLVFRAITRLASGHLQASLDDYEKSKRRKESLVPDNRLRFLYAEYLHAIGLTNSVKEVLADWTPDYPMSDREALKASLLTGNVPGRLASERAGELARLRESGRNMDQLRDRANAVIQKGGQFDRMSFYALHYMLREFIMNNRSHESLNFLEGVNMGEMVRTTRRLDALPLLSQVREVSMAGENLELALKTLSLHAGMARAMGMTSLLKELLYEQGLALSYMGRYGDSAKIAGEGLALPGGDGDLDVKYRLLLMGDEIYLGKINEAVKRGESLKGVTGDEYRYVLYLLTARIEMLEIIKKKGAAEQEWKAVEDLIRKGLDSLDRSPDILNRFNRIDLVGSSLDYLISYRLSRRDYLGSLALAEMKKQAMLRSRFPGMIYSGELPESALKEFKGITDRKKGGERFIELLRKYPLLQAGALIRTLPVDAFQKRLPEKALALYLVRNGNDIFAWVIAGQFIEFLRIKEGYAQVREIVTQYRGAVSQLENTQAVSRDLAKVFRPLEKYYQSKELLIFITDEDLEAVPFEIMGDKDMLEETHPMVYLSSLLSGLREYHPWKRSVSLIGGPRNNVYEELETVALRESGIPYRISDTIGAGIGHLHRPLLFNYLNGEFYLGGRMLRDYLKGTGMIYLPSVEFSGRMGFNDLALFASVEGVKGMIINDAEIHDVNNAVFVDGFYREMAGGAPFLKAFEQAKYALRTSDRYKHPAYWAGIRFYLNCLP